MELERIVVAPDWHWLVVFYFFLGGIAAGAYFMAALIELIGTDQDRNLAKIAYYITFPLVAICSVLLIVDLGRPERFWHMLLQPETGRPIFKFWSPMSVGSWALMLFGSMASVSFVGVLAEDGRLGLGRFQSIAHALHRGPIGVIFELLAAGVGFFIAAYTGVLLTATSQPFWSDSPLLGALFLSSAASTGIAVILLSCRKTCASIERLEIADSWANGLELLLIAGFLISLGTLAVPFISSSYGLLLLIGVALIGLVAPLALRFAPQLLGKYTTPVAAVLVLVGGFVLRYSIVMAGQSNVLVAR